MNIIFKTLNTVLQSMYNFTGDWGIAIVLLTVIVKFVVLPFSIKQRMAMVNQQELLKKQQELKEKHKNNKKMLEKLDIEYAKKNAKSMLGCLISMVQMPVIYSLYSVVLTMPIQVGTAIVPWVASLKANDSYFIIPIIYAAVQMFPALVPYIKYLNVFNAPTSKSGILAASIISILITIKAPIAIGIYFITSGVFAFIEDLIFRLYYKNFALIKC